MKRTLILLFCLFQILDFTFGQSIDSLKTKASKEFAIELTAIQTSLCCYSGTSLSMEKTENFIKFDTWKH